MDESAAPALRTELRTWLEQNWTPDVAASLRDDDPERAFGAHRRWNATLFDAGFAAVGWPTEWGGRDAGVHEQLVVHEEMALAGAAGPVNAIGVSNIAPAIMALGTDEQQRRFLRPMLRGDEIWSQGMSEPEAGSDLASLRCRAVLDGDHFEVDGQKTWNSNGHRADWCQLYVRTDPDASRHEGITCLLVPLDLPGIEVRPIRTMAGDIDFSELFLDGVRVPVDAVLGTIGGGWAVATTTLSNERAGVASLFLRTRSTLDRLIERARTPLEDGSRAADSAVVVDALMRRWCEVRCLEFLARRTIAAALVGRAPGPEGSVIKLAWSNAGQAVARTAVDILGLRDEEGDWDDALLRSVSLSIAGGTSEVNKNIIGERVLGLPR